MRVRDIEIEAADAGDDEDRVRVPTFCLDAKALPAAEQFLLARYTLHEQVYFHKTTRCLEKMIAKLLGRVAELAGKAGAAKQTGLDKDHPLLQFFGKEGATLSNYLALDDLVVMGGIERMCHAADSVVSDLAKRLRERRLYKALDLGTFGHDADNQQRAARRIDKKFVTEQKNGNLIKDEGAAISVYTQIGGDDERAHKKLHILDTVRGPVEITIVSDVIKALREPKKFTRYYFENECDRDKALRVKKETT